MDKSAKRQQVRRLRERASHYRELIITLTFADTRTIAALQTFADDLDLQADELEAEIASRPYGA